MSNEIESFTYENFTVELFNDECFDSPRTWDNIGKMLCVHRRYTLGDNEKTTVEEIREIMQRADVLWLPLFLLDHSGLTMRTRNFSDYDPQQWDSGQVGIIYCDHATIRKEWKRVTKRTLELTRKCLEGEVAIYDAYLQGSVVAYSVRDETGEVVDSCGGFYITSDNWSADKEYVRKQARNHVDFALRKRQAEVANVERVFGLA